MADVRRPRRRDHDDLVGVVAAVFARLPPWVPLAALCAGNAAVSLAFTAFHWPVTLRADALLATTLFFGITGTAGLLERARRLRRLTRTRAIDDLLSMSPDDFEHLVMSAYAALGWSASLTRPGADGGADVILRRGREKALVQCKRWKAKQVGVGTIRELHSVMVTERATGGIVVTCGSFSPDALARARTVGIECIDGDELLTLVASTRGEVELRPVPADDRPPACPDCGRQMVRRRSARGPFWGCAGYPGCRGLIDIAVG